ncbi:tRNA glutamyl-Q(34) synthetase GluQRS [Marinobacter orientalis]|uniref:tRNA glutamyl-Q(34) synthetase GluQRS n=1 Tax=Marinobacter orientalis TaxID=1928859 RepID=A0A7Y0WRZ0_9GAMM|nr:tRNA glutamyl-Q(34) synthetase GluQRS [Marinobacter orientalis]NMT63327.1 tRNA glutamyl-Q(34) synthetase GluQRS [Marinobacter orientalis]TGX51972.1 tRNA glutamyl-Q(34) synthetase GluQRS [Marinobacter orientalis]
MTESRYRGRFAPSPTGPLHFGSLVTAVASFLEARSHGGTWLVRIEDLDPLRESPEATGQILASLGAHGLHSDEPVRFQSACHARYRKVIELLLDQGLAYRCACSRRQLKEHGGRHPDHCRQGHAPNDGRPFAVRFALEDEQSEWRDQLLGPQSQTVHAELDDPVILRKEGFYAYQLAVVADDIDQGITHVVRGSDLLDMTAQQQQIYRSLGARPPHWMHIPVILNAQGQKLSKQNHAPALDDRIAKANLEQALAALGQNLRLLSGAPDIDTLLSRATANWSPERIHLTAR